MNQELSTSLAEEIAAKHSQAMSTAYGAREAIQQARDIAADCGILLEKVMEQHKGFAKEWLRQHVPTLPIEQAKVYLGLCKVRRERINSHVDTRQMKLLGITGDDELASEGGHSTGQRAGGDRWIKWKSHIVQEFRERDSIKPIEQWESYERKAWQDELRDVALIYKRAGGSL
jgi:hypothetical protein